MKLKHALSSCVQSRISSYALAQVLTSTFYVALWITLSGTVILYNKWILAYYGFPYPITLTMWHMLFSSVRAWHTLFHTLHWHWHALCMRFCPFAAYLGSALPATSQC